MDTYHLEPCNNCNELTTIIVYTDSEPSGYKSLKDKNGVVLCLYCQENLKKVYS